MCRTTQSQYVSRPDRVSVAVVFTGFGWDNCTGGVAACNSDLTINDILREQQETERKRSNQHGTEGSKNVANQTCKNGKE